MCCGVRGRLRRSRLVIGEVESSRVVSDGRSWRSSGLVHRYLELVKRGVSALEFGIDDIRIGVLIACAFSIVYRIILLITFAVENGAILITPGKYE